ncbi:methyl-accepting chemotaxis protein [Ferribacterium limneticum]|uniref:methyl-accepting chemotaxis protein n=1 Tax=Ferribacterium limneticum TaxID=76259 RepID=UPI001CF7FA73|nr:methyl-accepting chemotaxis protein [Ferribacterium limneticum]UCV21519.1 methyl-accepting chemotaxis protein [Ferribacterium limneticum]
MTSNESVSALRSCMNSLRLRLFGAWLLAVGGGAALAGLVLTNQVELWASAAVAMLGVSLLVAFRLQYGLEAALALIDGFALELAAGRLVSRLDARHCGALAPLAERLNGMARSLSGLFLTFARMSQEISSVAGESSVNATGGDDGVRRQRDITLSSSATLEQLTVSLGMTSESAQGAASVAEASGQMAMAGAERVSGLASSLENLAATVQQTSESASRLGQRSREIDVIVELIAEIAAQTNLLALNAAIEAARAGEQGRGFAVVADEVRKLAERTSNATRDIGERIEGVRNEVGGMIDAMAATSSQAAKSLSDAGDAVADLRRVEDNARQTLALIRDIAAASQEQSEAGQNIARDIEQVAQLADANEHLVRENSELSRYLNDLSVQLTGALKKYQYE